MTLVWAEEFERIDEAYAMEKRVQGWRRDKRIALIEGRYDDLPLLALKGEGSVGTEISDEAHKRLARP